LVFGFCGGGGREALPRNLVLLIQTLDGKLLQPSLVCHRQP
jgi:hypothetical protein